MGYGPSAGQNFTALNCLSVGGSLGIIRQSQIQGLFSFFALFIEDVSAVEGDAWV